MQEQIKSRFIYFVLSFQNGFKQRGVRSSFGAGNNAVVMKMTPYSTVREGLHRISREKKKGAGILGVF